MVTILSEPFVCPECSSKRVTYTKDASLAFTQMALDDGHIVVGDGDVEEFDNILDIQCLDCQHYEDHARRGHDWLPYPGLGGKS